MWIDFAEKKYYMDGCDYGLRLRFYSGINQKVKEHCKHFCMWLRKRFWFPIRCNIMFFNYNKLKSTLGVKCSALYIYPNESLKEFPCIWIATGEYEKRRCKYGDKIAIMGELHSIAHELTHYFQWYFFENEKRTTRSREIEANKWAKYLVTLYIEEQANCFYKFNN